MKTPALDAGSKRIALITGSNRGLGWQACLQLGKAGYHPILTSRNEHAGRAALEKLQALGIKATLLPLDVTQDESVGRLQQQIRERFGRLDVLLNNAGVFLDGDDRPDGKGGTTDSTSALEVPVSVIQKTFETNLFGAYRMCQAFAPLLIETAQKPDALCRIVNVSSGMGQLGEMNGNYPAYRFSKAALNALTRVFAEELSSKGILVNSVCPGWVKTDMGGPGAELTPEQGADTLVWAATLPKGAPTGGFFRERERIDW